MAYNPGFCGQARRGGAGEKGSDFILCGVVLFHKETCRPPGPYRATPKPLLRDTTSLVLFWPLHSLCALSSPTRDQTRAPAVKAQIPNYWTTRESPNLFVFKGHPGRALGQASPQLLEFFEWLLGASPGLGSGGLSSALV